MYSQVQYYSYKLYILGEKNSGGIYERRGIHENM